MSIKDKIIDFFFGQTIEEQVKRRLAMQTRIDDSPGWQSSGQYGTNDRNWSEQQKDMDDALVAWRKNFIVRHIVVLTHSYVIGGGITFYSKNQDVNTFIQKFWNLKDNKMSSQLDNICDALTRSGELFPILFTRKADGMSIVRFVPAKCIPHIQTDPADLTREISYSQPRIADAPLTWIGINHKHAFKTRYNKLAPLMLHWAVNRPIGAVRGESDLVPVLPWAKRYTEWLKDRARLNRIRTKQAIIDITLDDDSQVAAKRAQLTKQNPLTSGIYVHGKGETLLVHPLNINSDDASPDGRAMRLAIAAGSHIALHYMGEGEGVNYATAKEMGEPTARFYTDRQQEIVTMLETLIETAYRRQKVMLGIELPPDFDPQIKHITREIARADNESLAKATSMIVRALAIMKKEGWVDDEEATRIAFKFSGETHRQ